MQLELGLTLSLFFLYASKLWQQAPGQLNELLFQPLSFNYILLLE